MKPLSYILKRLFLLIVFFNVVYISSNLLYYRNQFSLKEAFSSLLRHQNVFVDSLTDESIFNENINDEIEKLLKKVESDPKRYWLKDTDLTNTGISINPRHFLKHSKDPNAWTNKNHLFYDIRFTLSIYLNYVKQKLSSKKSETDPVEVPFNWVDWLDLSYLNDNDLRRPLRGRRKCRWMERHVAKANGYKREDLCCVDNEALTPEQVAALGFERHEQLPGYVVDGHSLNRASIDVRIAQARSYLMTHMPNPYKLMFLNKENGTYEVNVKQYVPKERILKSNLVEEYLKDKFPSNSHPPNQINLDPVQEFQSLKQSVVPTYLPESHDLYGIYKETHSNDDSLDKSVDLPRDVFRYGPESIDSQITAYEQVDKLRGLDFIENSYLTSLKLSKERNTDTEDVYFRQATLTPGSRDKKNKANDQGYHYDWRFFEGTLNGIRKGWTDEELYLRQEVILDRLTRNWFRFAHEKGLTSWNMHGPLLSWYWNGMMFPFDNDLDIQMPIGDLARLGELYNQTLVIEDIEEGFGKYLIDVGTFIHNRDISKRENHIDARFIDIDSGLYIDITGLSTSTAEIQEQFEKDKELVNISKDHNEEIYNDRRKHFYKHEQLSPLKYSMLGGVPSYAPNDITKRLMFEYPSGITNPSYSDWHFIPKINLWVNTEKLTKVFDQNDFRKINQKNKEEDGQIENERLAQLVLDMSDAQVLSLLRQDDDVLCEFYKTRHLTQIHEEEKKFLFAIQDKQKIEVSDNGEHKIKHELSVSDKKMTDQEYAKYKQFVNQNIRMTPPLRKSFFQFEYIDHPLHHHMNHD